MALFFGKHVIPVPLPGLPGVDITEICDLAAIRTRDRLLRRQMLYPAELPDLTISAQWHKEVTH